MIALYILGFLVLSLSLLCLLRLGFTFSYSDSPKLRLKVLCFEFTLVPVKKKDKKKPEKKIRKKKKEPSKNDAEQEKKPSFLKKLGDKKGVSGLLTMLLDISKLATTTLKGIFTNIVIEKLSIRLTVVGEDAADTALKYGKVCSVFYSAVYVICDNVKKYDNYELNVTPDFDDEAKMRASAEIKFYIRVFYVVRYLIRALFRLIMIRYKR